LVKIKKKVQVFLSSKEVSKKFGERSFKSSNKQKFHINFFLMFKKVQKGFLKVQKRFIKRFFKSSKKTFRKGFFKSSKIWEKFKKVQ